jgi:hypothetical protein
MALLKWLRSLFPEKGKALPHPLKQTMSGWTAVEQNQQITVWQDADGDALSFARNATFDFPALSDENAVRGRCRALAQNSHSGLVEAAVVQGVDGSAVIFIQKRLDLSAYVYTGMLVMSPNCPPSSVWTVVARERGPTGVREAWVTATLMQAGKLSAETHEKSWAHDPYYPAYAGVDRRVLRFISDGAVYDSQFPHHPLSKVRRELQRLLTTSRALP